MGKRMGPVSYTHLDVYKRQVRSLASSKDAKEKNKMKTDWDGSSDKYARMIAKWLEKLGLVKHSRYSRWCREWCRYRHR